VTLLATTAVADVRQLASLFNNNLFSDAQIVKLFNDGASELYDFMVGQYETYFLTSVDFTLAGGVGANVFAMPMDKLLKDNTLEMNPTNNTPIPIPRLGSWSDRNRIGLTAGGCSLDGGRRYYPAGSNLMIFPPNLAGGTFRLWYTPKYIPILPPQPVPPLVASVPATFSGVSTNGVYGFSGSNWQAVNIGDSITVTGAINAVNNGTFQIVSVGGVNAVTVNNPASASEAPGAIAVTWQGPLSTFNVVMEPWYLYPEIHAAIAIRTSRQQDTSDLQPKLAALKQRIASATANRTEEVAQSPLRDGQRWGNSYFGGD
jgi:hypothetical protein